MSDLSKDLNEFVRLLVANEVEFVVVGGMALGYHGVVRYTGDIDFFVSPGETNAQRIVKVLKEFGFASLGLRPEDFLDPDLILQLGREPNRIDLITAIDGVTFSEAWDTRVLGELDGIHVAFLSRDALIRNKLTSAREKDLLDVKELRRREPGAQT